MFDGHVNILGGSLSIGSLLNLNYELDVRGLAIKHGSNLWATHSDARLKRNVSALSPGSLDSLLMLRGYHYEFTEEAIEQKRGHLGRHTGFLAQEVEKVFPDWVSEDPDGYRILEPGGIFAHTIEALRELRVEKDSQIAEHKAHIQRLEERINRLEAIVKELAPQSDAGGR